MPFYAVANGRVPGIYQSWEECCNQVHKFKSSKYKKFNSKTEAEQFILANKSTNQSDKNKSNRSSFINNPSSIQSLSRSTQFPSITSIASTTRPMSRCSLESVLIEKVVKKSKNKLNVIKRSMSSLTAAHQETIVISDDEKTPCKSKTTSKQAFDPVDNEDSIIILDDEALVKKNNNKNSGQSNLNSNIKNNNDANNNISIRTSPRNCVNKSNQRTLHAMPDFIPLNVNNVNHDENKSKNIPQIRPKNLGHVVVYTDGACSNNGYANAKAGIGVWWGNNDPRNLSEPLIGHPTNNRAEIWAAIKAIDKAADEGYDSIQICSDSDFLIKSAKFWVYKWQKNGWLLSDRKKVKNKDDFEKLIDSMKKIKVVWEKVKSHIGIHGNEEADRLANEAIGVKKSSK